MSIHHLTSRTLRWGGALLALLTLAGCSGAMKQRAEQREKLSASSGYYCEFINGDEYQDIDVELNLSLARRCDSSKSSTITGYKNSSDVYGVIYCCTLAKKEEPVRETKKPSPPPAATKPAAPSAPATGAPAPGGTTPKAPEGAAKPADKKGPASAPAESDDAGLLD